MPLAAMAACLAIGIAIGWWLRATGGPRPAIQVADESQPTYSGESPRAVAPFPPSRLDSRPVATSGSPAISAPPPGAELGGAIEILQRRDLRVPIDGVDPDTFRGGFNERRSGDGGHPHEAVDMVAPRSTPVHAAEEGTIAKLFDSRAGGHAIYQFDPGGRFAYYYAHLDRYADGLHDGQRVSAGDVIGYVGTSGNAPSGTPHLHFAVFELGPEKRWWQGQPLDPYLVFRKSK